MLNRIDIIGRLVRDPEYRTVGGNNTSVCNFTLAVDDDFKNQDGEKETDFIECTAWRQAAEFVTRYLTKGQMMAVSGRLKSRKWTDKDGNRRTSWFIKADNVYSVESKKDAAQSQQGSNSDYGNYSGGYGQQSYGGGYHPTVQPGQEFAELEGEDGNLPF
jgi:single-strand DNA-binding protein